MKAIAAFALAVSSVVAGYSPATGLRAMYLSGAAYCSAASVQSWTCGQACSNEGGMAHITTLKVDSDGSFGYVGYQNGQIIVSFRGSTNIANWITNIDYFKTAYPGVPGANVHQGFYAAFKDISPQLTAAVGALHTSYPSATIVVTGHSLGGALATFAAADLKKRFAAPIVFYTYGSPRTGDQGWSDYVMRNLDYYRVTHYNDIVPHVPLTAQGFNHAGTEVWYINPGDDMTYTTCSNSVGQPENKNCANTQILTGVDAHLHYVGHQINNLCNSRDAADPWAYYLDYEEPTQY